MKISQRYLTTDEEESKKILPDEQKKLLTQREKIEEKREKVLEFLKWAGGKLESLAWVLLGLFILYYSNFFKVLTTNKNINQLFLIISLICLGIHIAMNLYSSFILPYVFKITMEIEKYNPRIIYTGAFTGFISFVTLIIAVWPVWGFLTIPMLLGMFFGYINSAAFLPGNLLGSILFALIFVGALFSTYIIQHEGYLH